MRRAVLIGAALAALVLGPAAAGPVALKPEVGSSDGKVTLGDLFDGAGAAANVLAAQGRPGAALVLDAGRLQALARANGLHWANETGLRRVVVGAGPAAPSAAAGVQRGAAEVLTYTRNLTAGEIVQPEDLAWGKVVAAAPDAASDPDAVIGKAAKRPLRAGAQAVMRDLAAPQVIRKDEMVQVVYAQGGVTLQLQAKALGGAAAGETFDAQNPASRKVIQAVAVGPGRAVVGPAADRLKAASVNPALMAALR